MTRYLLATVSLLGAVALHNGSAQAGQYPMANKAAGDGQLIVRTYDVADLVAANAKDATITLTAVMKILRQSIDPTSWKETGGPATMDYYPFGNALVVRQTPGTHQQVAKTLDVLRRLQPVEVGVEVRLMSLSPDMAKHFTYLADFQPPSPDDPLHSVEAALLNSQQRNAWMTLMQSDRTTWTMQAPRITLQNGQYGSVNIMDDLGFLDGETSAATVGFRANVLPIVATKRQDVLLFLDLSYATMTPVDAGKQTEPLQKVGLTKILAIPDGTTMVCKLGSMLAKTRNVCDTPLWSGPGDFEVLCRTVTSGVESQEVFLLITPRVINSDDK
jgi:hypothetical protein